MKKCWNCFKQKPEEEFYIRRYKGVVGRQTRCKACNAEVCAAWKKRHTVRKINAIYEAQK